MTSLARYIMAVAAGALLLACAVHAYDAHAGQHVHAAPASLKSHYQPALFDVVYFEPSHQAKGRVFAIRPSDVTLQGSERPDLFIVRWLDSAGELNSAPFQAGELECVVAAADGEA